MCKKSSVRNGNVFGLKDGYFSIHHTMFNTFIHVHILTSTYTLLSAVHSVLVFKAALY